MMVVTDAVIRHEKAFRIDRRFVSIIMSRYRTLGCYPCTGAIPSNATTLPEIIEEMVQSTQSERSTRVIDHDAEGSMEDKKKEGYF